PELSTLVREMTVTNSEAAYRALFDRLFNPIRRFVYSIVNSWESAEEIASDVLFMLWEKRERLVEVANVKYYAFVAARNKALNLLKVQTGKETISLDDIDMDIRLYAASPETIFLQGELKIKLDNA